MNERGVFAVDRGIWKHPAFKREPYTEREAWLWMVGAAAWKDTKVRVRHSVVQLKRGQLPHSERFLAEKWGWKSKTRVHRFFIRLKNEAMITLQADHGTNLTTIYNYEKYAFNGTARKPKTEPPSEPIADQRRTKEEEREEGKKEELILESAHSAPQTRPAKEKTSRGTRLPSDWQPSAADLKFATDHGLRLYEAEIEATKFRNYWTAKAGRDATKLDWARTWQNWILNATGGRYGKRINAQNGNGAQRSGGVDFIAGLAEVAKDISGHGEMAGSAAEEIPLGRFNIDG
jgi:hypothetical protein